MLDFEEKKKIKNIVYSRVSLVILFILIILVAKGTWNAYNDAKMTRENKQLAEQQFQELEKREEIILSEIEQLNTQEGKEKEIRSKFSVVKDGEKMIMVVNSEDRNNNSNFEGKKKSLWWKFKNLFN